ncbi:MAG TPA: DUF3667 domain-containing protein [Gammaproteobacteria bacterium]|nr:DUF3667 domain-containing protein [Gammaproteobacteria bacterium]
MSTEAPHPSATCASCGQPLDGSYCSRCGEERLDPHKLTVWHFVTRALPGEIFDLDGKIWRTVRLLLFRPAFLALEYSAGRRRLYVKPLRVLLTAIVVYVLVMPSGTSFTINVGSFRVSIAPVPPPRARSVGGTTDQIDRFGLLERMLTNKIGPVAEATSDVTNRFNDMLNGLATPLSFTTVAFLALVLYGCFHRRRPLLVEHAVFSMHYFSFVLLTTLLDLVVLRLGKILEMPSAFLVFLLVVSLWQFAYLAVAIRKFYLADTRRLLALPAAGLFAALLYVSNTLFITAVQLVAAAIAVWRL